MMYISWNQHLVSASILRKTSNTPIFCCQKRRGRGISATKIQLINATHVFLDLINTNLFFLTFKTCSWQDPVYLTECCLNAGSDSHHVTKGFPIFVCKILEGLQCHAACITKIWKSYFLSLSLVLACLGSVECLNQIECYPFIVCTSSDLHELEYP